MLEDQLNKVILLMWVVIADKSRVTTSHNKHGERLGLV